MMKLLAFVSLALASANAQGPGAPPPSLARLRVNKEGKMTEEQTPATSGNPQAGNLRFKQTALTYTYATMPYPAVENKPDGSYVENHPDGTWIQHSPDGSTMERLSNGIVQEHRPDGSWSDERADGVTVENLPDGSLVEDRADGTWTQRKMDGTIIEREPDNNLVETHTDGLKITIHPDGSNQAEDTNIQHPARFRKSETKTQQLALAATETDADVAARIQATAARPSVPTVAPAAVPEALPAYMYTNHPWPPVVDTEHTHTENHNDGTWIMHDDRGNTEERLKNGDVVEKHPDGTSAVEKSNGITFETDSEHDFIEDRPDGTWRELRLDGTTMERLHNNDVKTVQANGDIVIKHPDNSADIVHTRALNA